VASWKHPAARIVVGIALVAAILGMPAASAEATVPPRGPAETVLQAPVCQADETPAFRDELARLKERLGATMGDPAECAHSDAASGDIVQATTTGLAYVRAATSTPTFTNGGRRWALTPAGLVTWEGDVLDAPDDAEAVTEPPSGQTTAAVMVTPAAGGGNAAPAQATTVPRSPAPTTPSAPADVPWRMRVLGARATNQVSVMGGLGTGTATAKPGFTIVLVDVELTYTGTVPRGSISTLEAQIVLPSGASQRAEGLGTPGLPLTCAGCVSISAINSGQTSAVTFAFGVPSGEVAGPLAFGYHLLAPVPIGLS
jgi:hypothetical protein